MSVVAKLEEAMGPRFDPRKSLYDYEWQWAEWLADRITENAVKLLKRSSRISASLQRTRGGLIILMSFDYMGREYRGTAAISPDEISNGVIHLTSDFRLASDYNIDVPSLDLKLDEHEPASRLIPKAAQEVAQDLINMVDEWDI